MKYDLAFAVLAFALALGGHNEAVRLSAALLTGGWIALIVLIWRPDFKDFW